MRAAVATLGEDITVVAHSAGGKVAQYVATDAPANLARLVLLAPGTARGISANPKHRVLTERAFGSRRRIEAFQRGAMARDVSEEAMERIVDDALVAQREAWFGWYDNGRTASFADRIGGVRVPTSVLVGDADPLTPASRLQREVVDLIPGATLTVLAGVGHNIPIEAPGAVAAVVEQRQQATAS